MNITFGRKLTQPLFTIMKVSGVFVAVLFLILQERTVSWWISIDRFCK